MQAALFRFDPGYSSPDTERFKKHVKYGPEADLRFPLPVSMVAYLYRLLHHGKPELRSDGQKFDIKAETV